MFRVFAAALPGLEDLVLQELTASNSEVRNPHLTPGGVEFEASGATVLQLCRGLRCTSTLLIRVGTFYAHTFAELEERMARLPWKTWLYADDAYEVRVTCERSRLYHTKAIEERIRRSIRERIPTLHLRRASTPPISAAADLSDEVSRRLHVRLTGDQCTLSFDAAGDPLYRRGYRPARVRAPLREDVARALLIDVMKVFGTGKPKVLLDPMCGSGTLLIEAGELLSGAPFPQLRSYAIEQTPLMLSATLGAEPVVSVHGTGSEGESPATVLWGCDLHAPSLEAAGANARRAGIEVALEQLDVFKAQPSTHGEPDVVVVNPPWGERLGGQNIPKLLSLLMKRYPTSVFGIVVPWDQTLPSGFETTRTTKMGGISIKLAIRKPD